MPDNKTAEQTRPIPSQAEGDDPPAAGAGSRPTPSQAEGDEETIDRSLRDKENNQTRRPDAHRS